MKMFAATVLMLSLYVLATGKADRRGPEPPAAPDVAGSSGGDFEEPRDPVVRVAELEIDPARLADYTAAVKEEMETSVRIEPGVLAIYAVAEKEEPSRLRFFEMYADEASYKAHLDSDHFRKYVTTTRAMIVSRKLIDAVPVQLSAKRDRE